MHIYSMDHVYVISLVNISWLSIIRLYTIDVVIMIGLAIMHSVGNVLLESLSWWFPQQLFLFSIVESFTGPENIDNCESFYTVHVPCWTLFCSVEPSPRSPCLQSRPPLPRVWPGVPPVSTASVHHPKALCVRNAHPQHSEDICRPNSKSLSYQEELLSKNAYIFVY